MKDLDTHYSVEDMYDMLEIAQVDAHNAKAMAKMREREQRMKVRR